MLSMLMNGNGILKTDNNADKDLVLRGNLKTSFGLNIGASFYRGRFLDTTAVATFDESAAGIHLRFNQEVLGRAFELQGEYVFGSYQTSGDDIEPRGYYIYGTCYILPKFEVGIRYDALKPDAINDRSAEQKRTSLMAGYYFDRSQRISMNYEIRNDELKGTGNIFILQFQMAI